MQLAPTCKGGTKKIAFENYSRDLNARKSNY